MQTIEEKIRQGIKEYQKRIAENPSLDPRDGVLDEELLIQELLVIFSEKG